jgi:hypothetical protein
VIGRVTTTAEGAEFSIPICGEARGREGTGGEAAEVGFGLGEGGERAFPQVTQ